MMLSRRSVLQGIVGAVAVGAGGCAGLPFARLPKKDRNLIALLSDCHVGNWKSPHYQAEKFAECIARVLALDPLPSQMFIPGDLAYLWGRREDYVLACRLLQPVMDAGIEVTIGMGNHDRRENFLEMWPEYADRSPVGGRIVSKMRGVYFDYIMLDTLDQPTETEKWITQGKLDGVQQEWLRSECRAAKRPLLVMGHHPAGELGDGPDPARNFGEILLGTEDAPTQCCGYMHGHDHQWYVTRSLLHWSDPRIGQTAALPSTGHWGDIGYSLLREYPDRAELSLVQYDYFSPSPSDPGAPVNAAWRAVVRDNASARCTFVAPK